MNSLFSEKQLQVQEVLFYHSDLMVSFGSTKYKGELSAIICWAWTKVKTLSLNYTFAKSFVTQRFMLTASDIIFINTEHSNVTSYRSFCNTLRILSILEKKRKLLNSQDSLLAII